MERGAPLQQEQQVTPAAIAQPILPQPSRTNTSVVSILLQYESLYIVINKLLACFDY